NTALTLKTAGSDGSPGRILKTCAKHLAYTFKDISSFSLLSTVPVCFKATTINPIPKKSIISCMSDYRLIALSHLVKRFKRLILSHKTMYPQSAVKDLLKKSEILSPGPPALHRLHTTRSNLDKECKIRKWTFGQKHGNLQNNTILMVGETGTGKTTLINTMVNYFLGVKFEDKVWFEITEEEQRDPTESQTSEVTVYEIISEENNTSLTIIDTPGYGDTRGIEKDEGIARNLHDLFLHDAGVKDLDAVCLVLKASQNRISDRQRYIFEAVLSLFGKDIEDIIVLFITHSDGIPPTDALEAIKKEKIPCCYDDENEPVHFLFNNRQSEKHTQQYEQFSRSAWEMGERSMEEFFEFLKSQQRRSLTLTVSVLNERMQLEASVECLKERIKFSDAKQNELTEVQKTLKQNKEKIKEDEKFPFTVTTVYKEKVDTTDASWWNRMVTSCGECQENCHEYNCWFARNAKWCKVMKDNCCSVCSCLESKHIRESKKYVTTRREEVVTFEKLKNKYGSTGAEEAAYDKSLLKSKETEHGKNLEMKEEMTNLEIKLKKLLAENEAQKKSLVKEAYMTIIKLSEIALKPDSAFTIQYLDFLIPRVEESGTAEWAQKLKDLQRAAAAQESTNSTARRLSAITKDIQNAANKRLSQSFSSEKKDMKGSSKESTYSLEEHDNKGNRVMQNTSHKESAYSLEEHDNKGNRVMQNTPLKESANSLEEHDNKGNRVMQNTPHKESAYSLEEHDNKGNRVMQNTPLKESANSLEEHDNKGNRVMQNTPHKESAYSLEEHDNKGNRVMQNTPLKESANSLEEHDNKGNRVMQNTPPKESAYSPERYKNEVNRVMQYTPPKESAYSPVWYKNEVNRVMQNTPPKESAYSPVWYKNEVNRVMQNTPPKESAYSPVWYKNEVNRVMQNTPPKESAYSPERYKNKVNRVMQNTPPKESAYSPEWYKNKVNRVMQYTPPKASAYSPEWYKNKVNRVMQYTPPKESAYSPEWYKNKVNRVMQYTPPKESAYSPEWYENKVNRVMQYSPPKESAYSPEWYENKVNRVMQYTPPKASAYSPEWYKNKVHRVMQYTPPKVSAYSPEWYENKVHRVMQYTPPKVSAYSPEWYENKGNRVMQYTPPKESAYSPEWYENKRNRVMQYTPPKESAYSPEWYENKGNRVMQYTPPKESAYSPEWHKNKVNRVMQYTPPKESAYSPEWYENEVNRVMQYTPPKESAYSPEWYENEVNRVMQYTPPKESAYSPEWYENEVNRVMQYTPPKESAYSPEWYENEVNRVMQYTPPKESAYSPEWYENEVNRVMQYSPPKESAYSPEWHKNEVNRVMQYTPPKESAYSPEWVRKGDEWKTAFLTTRGHYEYQVMSFGLRNAPSVFQAFINDVFREMLGQFVIAYIDESAFKELKIRFTTALLLTHPDPSRPFVVEVDASNVGVGAVLSQRGGETPKLYPVAYFSNKLTPAEKNYGIGDRELLAIKLAFEEWHHWLEGARHPFMVLTDHKNLEYLRNVKRLNSRQARWSLFFSRFDFQITYCPGTRNAKADALSRLFEEEPGELSTGKPILEPRMILSPIRWVVDEEIEQHNATEPIPAVCPPDRLFVPAPFRDRLITWAHTSLTSGHPGQTRTFQLLSGKYWWEVDRFSRGVRFIPFPSLPTAFQTAETLFHQVFRLFSIPENIVSDRGYQAPLMPWMAQPSSVPAVDHWLRRSGEVWEQTHRRIGCVLRRHKRHADRKRGITPSYTPGDQVWLSTRDFRLQEGSRKLAPKFIGPFQISEKINDVMYRLELPPAYRMCTSFHVSLLKPVVPGPLDELSPADTPPLSVMVEGTPVYAVRRLLDSRRRGWTLQYLVDWDGYGPEEQSWVPTTDVLDPALVAEFHRSHPSRPAPRPRGRPRGSTSNQPTIGRRGRPRRLSLSPAAGHRRGRPGRFPLDSFAGPQVTGSAGRVAPGCGRSGSALPGVSD
ncbi:hypothetical protein NFI96_006631, partial [Prochilodus magdalenae]